MPNDISNGNIHNIVDTWINKGYGYNLYGIINDWNVSNVTDMSGLFQDTSFNETIKHWNVSKVTNMSNMFNGASNFNQDISDWNVSKVTNMSNMFNGASNFNKDISDWDVSKVTNMSGLFQNASNFNQDINKWDFSNVTNMSYMFSECYIGHNLGINWDVGKVTDMNNMFAGCVSNTDNSLNVYNWNVSNVTNMNSMFTTIRGLVIDNIGQWDVGKVINMGYMFYDTSFNQYIGGWNVSNVNNMSSMFTYTNFNQDLSNWNIKDTYINKYLGLFNYKSNFKNDYYQNLITNNLKSIYKLLIDSIYLSDDYIFAFFGNNEDAFDNSNFNFDICYNLLDEFSFKDTNDGIILSNSNDISIDISGIIDISENNINDVNFYLRYINSYNHVIDSYVTNTEKGNKDNVINFGNHYLALVPRYQIIDNQKIDLKVNPIFQIKNNTVENNKQYFGIKLFNYLIKSELEYQLYAYGLCNPRIIQKYRWMFNNRTGCRFRIKC